MQTCPPQDIPVEESFDAIRSRVKKWSDQYTAQHSTSKCTPVEQFATEMQQKLERLMADSVLVI